MKIALVGRSSCGKSTTLNLVYDSLVERGATVEKEKIVLGNPIQKDFECVLNYKGKKIAFYTMGDFPDKIGGEIKPYEECDVLILAIATDKFGSEQALSLFNSGTDHIVHKTIDVANQLEANKGDCDGIMRLLEIALQ
jgi:ABC-type dipeptide/oligopeptide/nickel transport system ATPase component